MRLFVAARTQIALLGHVAQLRLLWCLVQRSHKGRRWSLRGAAHAAAKIGSVSEITTVVRAVLCLSGTFHEHFEFVDGVVFGIAILRGGEGAAGAVGGETMAT